MAEQVGCSFYALAITICNWSEMYVIPGLQRFVYLDSAGWDCRRSLGQQYMATIAGWLHRVLGVQLDPAHSAKLLDRLLSASSTDAAKLGPEALRSWVHTTYPRFELEQMLLSDSVQLHKIVARYLVRENGQDVARTRDEVRDLTDRVRALLLRGQGALGPAATAADLAEALHVSERTLHRQLKDEGASLQAIKDDVRRQRAQDLLQRSRKPIKHIAAEVGFGSEKSFIRAFKGWTGQTPDGFRQASF
jgi:AraC-like DNA-binding protein